MTLVEIFKKSKTDKHQHGYAKTYQKLFDDFRDKSITFWEIGVKFGHSLEVWNRYFSQAIIEGFDIVNFPKVAGIPVHKLDQDNKDEMYEVVASLKRSPMIIIEDGGHRPEHHQKSLAVFFKVLQPGGIYVIEDLQVCAKDNKQDNIKFGVTDDNNTVTYLQKLLTDAPVQSLYMTLEEEEYLRDNIKSIEFEVKSKLAIITKK